jgi:hypothetical protein
MFNKEDGTIELEHLFYSEFLDFEEVLGKSVMYGYLADT